MSTFKKKKEKEKVFHHWSPLIIIIKRFKTSAFHMSILIPCKQIFFPCKFGSSLTEKKGKLMRTNEWNTHTHTKCFKMKKILFENFFKFGHQYTMTMFFLVVVETNKVKKMNCSIIIFFDFFFKVFYIQNRETISTHFIIISRWKGKVFLLLLKLWPIEPLLYWWWWSSSHNTHTHYFFFENIDNIPSPFHTHLQPKYIDKIEFIVNT